VLLTFDPMYYGSSEDIFGTWALNADGSTNQYGFQWIPDHDTFPAVQSGNGAVAGTKCTNLAGRIYGTLSVPKTRLYCGMRVLLPRAQTIDLSFGNSSRGQRDGFQTGILLDAGAAVQAYSDGVTHAPIGRSGTNAFPHDNWFFLEYGATFSAIAGTVDVRVEGVNVLSLANVPTLTAGVAGADQIGIGGGGITTISIQDFYVCDDVAGPGTHPNNGFLGDCRAVVLQPLMTVGSPGWTPNGGTTVGNVDDLVCDFDATYNYTTTVNAKDRFSFTSLPPIIDTVLGVQLRGTYRKDDAGTRTARHHIYSGAVEAFGNLFPMTVSYTHRTGDLWPVDPATGNAWTVAGVNALQAAYELTG
jgi:hypothetical protein